MSKFACFLQECKTSVEFCEIQSQRCRDCRDYEDLCFKDNLHISNCSSFCFDVLKKNLSVPILSNCTVSDLTYLSERHHLLIEISLFLVLAVVLGLIFLQRFVPLFDIFRRFNGLKNKDESMLSAISIDNGNISSKQPLLMQNQNQTFVLRNQDDDASKQSLQHANTNCGFTQHNQISNATKDEPSLCVSGRNANETAT